MLSNSLICLSNLLDPLGSIFSNRSSMVFLISLNWSISLNPTFNSSGSRVIPTLEISESRPG